MKYRTPITVAELIELIVKKQDEEESYCVYGNTESSEAELSSICYVDAYPEITDDNEELYPKFVEDNDLDMWYRDELVQDVVSSVLKQDSKATSSTILKAIKYYSENDDFLDIE